MNIFELNINQNLEFIETILKPFDFEESKRDIIFNNFRNELKEIGENRVFYVGEVDTSPVSTGQMVLKNAHNAPQLANGIDIAHVHNLWTKKDCQRMGYAKLLMEHLEKNAIKRGVKILTLGVDDFNQAAISLYKKLGYSTFKEELGRTPEEKLFLMRKFLI